MQDLTWYIIICASSALSMLVHFIQNVNDLICSKTFKPGDNKACNSLLNTGEVPDMTLAIKYFL